MGFRKWWGLLAMMALLPSAAVAQTWYVFDADTDTCVTSKVLAAQERIPSIVDPWSFIQWAHNKPWFEGYEPSKKSRGLSILYKHGEFSYWPGNNKKGCESYVKILQHHHLAPLSIQPNFPRFEANVRNGVHSWRILDQSTGSYLSPKQFAAYKGTSYFGTPWEFIKWARNKPLFGGYLVNKQKYSIFYGKKGSNDVWIWEGKVAHTMPTSCDTPKAHADMRQALAEIDRQNTGKWMTYKKTFNTYNLSPASPDTLTCLVGYTIRRHGINLFADSRITVQKLSHGRGYSARMP